MPNLDFQVAQEDTNMQILVQNLLKSPRDWGWVTKHEKEWGLTHQPSFRTLANLKAPELISIVHMSESSLWCVRLNLEPLTTTTMEYVIAKSVLLLNYHNDIYRNNSFYLQNFYGMVNSLKFLSPNVGLARAAFIIIKGICGCPITQQV